MIIPAFGWPGPADAYAFDEIAPALELRHLGPSSRHLPRGVAARCFVDLLLGRAAGNVRTA